MVAEFHKFALVPRILKSKFWLLVYWFDTFLSPNGNNDLQSFNTSFSVV